jgi:hypothetical protein
MSSGFTLKMGHFARLAQATFLLSQAFQSMKSTVTEDEAAGPDQTIQLRRTLLALVHAADAEATVRKLEFCAQSGLSLRLVVFPRALGQASGENKSSMPQQKPPCLLSELIGQIQRTSNKPIVPFSYFRITTCTILPTVDARKWRWRRFGRRLERHWTDCRLRPNPTSPPTLMIRTHLTISPYS